MSAQTEQLEPLSQDLDNDDDSWIDDDSEWCDHCDGDGCDPLTDYCLPCPVCQGEQRP